jgi:uncharacterized SAM-binding protein YcdF (DUF218 family)
MGFFTRLLKFFGWVPICRPLPKTLDGVIIPSYGLKDLNSVTPLTRSVDLTAATIYHAYQQKPTIVFATTDFTPEDTEVEINVRKSFFKYNNISESQIFKARGTHNTISEAQQTLSLLRKKNPNLKNVLICLNELHVRRALSIYKSVAGNSINIYALPVPCYEFSASLCPVFFRRLSVRWEWCWTWYMLLTWLAWKSKIIN